MATLPLATSEVRPPACAGRVPRESAGGFFHFKQEGSCRHFRRLLVRRNLWRSREECDAAFSDLRARADAMLVNGWRCGAAGKTFHWLRADEVDRVSDDPKFNKTARMKLFQGEIEPKDVCQGQVRPTPRRTLLARTKLCRCDTSFQT